jgi:hypothetical protein
VNENGPYLSNSICGRDPYLSEGRSARGSRARALGEGKRSILEEKKGKCL